MDATSLDEITEVVVLAGEIMLKTGAETSRVEQTMEHIALSIGAQSVETFVVPTGVFVTVIDKSGRSLTTMRRVKSRTIDLDRISKVNELSRRLVDQRVHYEAAIAILKRIDSERSRFAWRVSTLAAGALGGGFALLQGGAVAEVVLAAVTAALVQFIVDLVGRFHGVQFTCEFLGSMTGALAGVTVTALFPHLSRDIIIVGGILPLVPGVAVTNAISDTMAGDLVSGISRGMEAALTAVAMAMGVVIVLTMQI